jgi:hypothetical protein
MWHGSDGTRLKRRLLNLLTALSVLLWGGAGRATIAAGKIILCVAPA